MKRTFTLLETLVALTLTAGLVALLLTTLLTTTKRKESELWPLLEQYSCRQRLSQVLPEILTPPILDEGALLFTFNNGVDDDPHFCGQVQGRLALKGNFLTLTLSPAPTRWEGEFPERTETLLNELSHLTFRFYETPTPDTPGQWLTEWEADDLPALLEVSCEPFTTTYAILESDKPPRYFR